MLQRKLNITFICIGNAHRSQLAEAFARKHGSDVLWNVCSAGTIPAHGYKWENRYFKIAHLEGYYKGLDMRRQFPKDIKALNGTFDVMILMGHDVVVKSTYFNVHNVEHWDIPRWDTSREVTNKIQDGVLNLLHRIRNGQYC